MTSIHSGVQRQVRCLHPSCPTWQCALFATISEKAWKKELNARWRMAFDDVGGSTLVPSRRSSDMWRKTGGFAKANLTSSLPWSFAPVMIRSKNTVSVSFQIAFVVAACTMCTLRLENAAENVITSGSHHDKRKLSGAV